MKKALFIAGGWDGHQPDKIANLFAGELRQAKFEAETSLDVLADIEKLKTYDVISPCWTMGALGKEQGEGLQAAEKFPEARALTVRGLRWAAGDL